MFAPGRTGCHETFQRDLGRCQASTTGYSTTESPDPSLGRDGRRSDFTLEIGSRGLPH